MQWFENDDFWREMFPHMFPPERFAAAAGDVTKILALSGFSGRTVLDLCCGPGRHSVEFARRGYQVTGVDRSSFLLDRARQRSAEAGVSVEWIADDMRHFQRLAAFDLVCNIFTSFGYFETEEEDLRVLRNVYESLTGDGIFLIELLGKERLARNWLSSICTECPDGSLLLQRPQVRNDWRRIHNEWTLIGEGRTRTFHFEHNIYSGRELHDRLLAAGFHHVQLFGDLAGAPYGLDALRLVAIARK
jgi:SAM-dependent methyltransferase